MGEPWKHYACLKKPDARGHTLWDSTDMKHLDHGGGGTGTVPWITEAWEVSGPAKTKLMKAGDTRGWRGCWVPCPSTLQWYSGQAFYIPVPCQGPSPDLGKQCSDRRATPALFYWLPDWRSKPHQNCLIAAVLAPVWRSKAYNSGSQLQKGVQRDWGQGSRRGRQPPRRGHFREGI